MQANLPKSLQVIANEAFALGVPEGFAYAMTNYVFTHLGCSPICAFWFNQKLNLGIDQHKIFVTACNTF
ncbi:MAG: hypothetical protein V7K18_09150 [Nostoc sp.]|uniref:hypothetical protein n=1 Tax=Nostoc sp. TaxID=1180 RepID=UPI002FFCCD30